MAQEQIPEEPSNVAPPPEDIPEEKGVNRWKELVDGPWLWAAIGLIGGSIASVAPVPTLPWIFGVAGIALTIHVLRNLLRGGKALRLLANVIVIPLIWLSLWRFHSYLLTKLPPAPLTAEDIPRIAEAVLAKMNNPNIPGAQANPKVDAIADEVAKKIRELQAKEISRVRAQAASLIFHFYGTLTQYEDDSNRTGQSQSSIKNLMMRYRRDKLAQDYDQQYRKQIKDVREDLMRNIHKMPEAGHFDRERLYDDKYTDRLTTIEMEQQLSDLRLMLNEMEKENGLSLSCTDIKLHYGLP